MIQLRIWTHCPECEAIISGLCRIYVRNVDECKDAERRVAFLTDALRRVFESRGIGASKGHRGAAQIAEEALEKLRIWTKVPPLKFDVEPLVETLKPAAAGEGGER